MATITLKNRTSGPIDVSQRRGRGRIPAGATKSFERDNLSPGWLDGALARHMVSEVAAKGKGHPPPPPPPPVPTEERKALLEIAEAQGKTIDPAWTDEQIMEALAS